MELRDFSGLNEALEKEIMQCNVKETETCLQSLFQCFVRMCSSVAVVKFSRIFKQVKTCNKSFNRVI